MESALKYIKEKTYDIEEGYTISLEEMPPGLAYSIAVFIEDHLPEVPINDFTTYIYASHVWYNDEVYYFAFELMRASGEQPTLTDLRLIDVNEYLDLINLNFYIKSNDSNRNQENKISPIFN